MIKLKNDDETYLCESDGNYYNIASLEEYMKQKSEIEAIPKPTDKELIELGKSISPYYQKNNALNNIDNVLSEIEDFENGNNQL